MIFYFEICYYLLINFCFNERNFSENCFDMILWNFCSNVIIMILKSVSFEVLVK